MNTTSKPHVKCVWIYSLPTNVLDKQSRTADKGWYFKFGVGTGTNKP